MKIQDKETRYFIDIDLYTNTVIIIYFGQREDLSRAKTRKHIHRVFLTKGQYNKLSEQISELKGK